LPNSILCKNDTRLPFLHKTNKNTLAKRSTVYAKF